MLDLPATVLPTWLVTLAAGHRPLGEADDMRRIATGWRDAEGTLTELADEVAAAATHGTGLAMGRTAVAVEQHMAERERVLRDLAECAGSLADQVVDGARHIEFQQLTVDLTMWAVAIQVGYAVVFPHGAVLTLAARVWAQQKFRTSLARTLARLLLEGAEYVAKRPILAVPLQGGISGALEGGTTDALAQRIQIRDDNREVVDTRSVMVSTAEGTAGGLAGDAGARWLAPGVARVAQPVARVAGVPVGRALQVLVLGGAGGLFGAPAGMAVSIAAAGGDPRDVTAQEWFEGLITGTGGGVIGAAGYGLRSTAAPLPVPSLEPFRIPNEPGSEPESATDPETAKSLDRPVTEEPGAISAPSQTPASTPSPTVAPAPPTTLRADSGGELIVGVPPPSATDLPDRVPTGTRADEPVSTTTAGRVVDRVPADTAPNQPVDQSPGTESTPTESIPGQPNPGPEPTGTAPRDTATGSQRNGPEYAASEPNTTETPQTERSAATTGTAADVPTSDDRFRAISSEATPERELSDSRFTDESTAPPGGTRLGPVESETPAPEHTSTQPDGGIDVPPIPAVVTDTPAQRPTANSTGGAGRTPAGAPAPTAQTRPPETGQHPRPGSVPDEFRPRVVAPNGPTPRAGTTAPGRSGVTAPADHAPAPPLPDRTTASKQNTPETDAPAAAAAPQQASFPSGPTENPANTTPEGAQSTRPRADIDADPSGTEPAPGPPHRADAEAHSSSPIPKPTVLRPTELGGTHAPDATEPVSSTPTDTLPDRAHEPDSAAPSDFSFEPAPYALDVSTHLALNRRREELFEAADTMLVDTERSLQTMWRTPPLERQLAELSDPGLRADELQQRLDSLRDKGISPVRRAELEAGVHRALEAHHEIGATARAAAQQMQHILRAYADEPAARPTWRKPHSPEPHCVPATLVALQALFPDTPRIIREPGGVAPGPGRSTPWSTPSAALSYLLGNRAEHVDSGAAAHRRTVEMLAGPRGEAPLPARGPGAVRRLVVVEDAYSPDHKSDYAHTYLAAKLNNGELVRLDLTFDTGPRRLEAPGDQVLFRKVYALDRHGTALQPAPTSSPHKRFPSATGRPPTGDPAHRGGRPAARDADGAEGVRDRAPETRTDKPAATPPGEPRPTTRINEPAATTHVEAAPETRANEPAPTTHVEPVSTADREFESGPRIGELEPGTHVEAVPVDGHRPGLRGWLLRMATNPVGMLMSGSLAASLGASVAGMSAAMSISMLTTSWLGSMVLTARNLATLLTTLPAGYVADRFDQRRVVRTCTFVGLGGAATGLVAMLSSGFLAPVAVAVAVAGGIFTYTAAEGFRRPSQAGLAARYAQNRPDNEQKEVGRLDILARQSSATLGSFLGPIFANLHPAVPLAVKGASSLLNLRVIGKVHRDFGEPPKLGEQGTDRRPRAKPEDTPLVNETTPGTMVNRPNPDTRVESGVDHAPRDGENRPRRPGDNENRPHPAEGGENRPHSPEDNESGTERSTTARDTSEHDGRDTEPAPTDQVPAEPETPRSWWGRTKDGIVAMFGPVWQDRYLRGITLVVAPLSGLATGMQSARIVEYMTHMGWWAGVLGAATGAFGIAGAVLGVLSFKKSTVKSLEPMTTTIWAATALPSAIWLNPFLILPSMAATSVLGLAANVKMADYMHEVDMRNSGGRQIGRMRAASTLMATGAMTAGTAGGGILLHTSGLAVTGFAQVGVLAAAAIVSGYYGFRHRKPPRAPAAGDSGP